MGLEPVNVKRIVNLNLVHYQCHSGKQTVKARIEPINGNQASDFKFSGFFYS